MQSVKFCAIFKKNMNIHVLVLKLQEINYFNYFLTLFCSWQGDGSLYIIHALLEGTALSDA